MSFKVDTIPVFDKQLKRLVKKYPSLKSEYSELITSLIENPQLGIPLGKSFYKIKLSVESKGKGKSGGVRVITYIKILKETVYLTSIYDKSEKENITNKELLETIEKYDL